MENENEIIGTYDFSIDGGDAASGGVTNEYVIMKLPKNAIIYDGILVVEEDLVSQSKTGNILMGTGDDEDGLIASRSSDALVKGSVVSLNKMVIGDEQDIYFQLDNSLTAGKFKLVVYYHFIAVK